MPLSFGMLVQFGNTMILSCQPCSRFGRFDPTVSNPPPLPLPRFLFINARSLLLRLSSQRYAAYKNTKSKIGNARRTEMLNQGRIDHRQVLKEQKLAARQAKGYAK